MSQALGLIPDGYTEEGYLSCVPRLYPDVSFTWRPALMEELAAYYRAAEKLQGAPLRRHAAKFIADHLASWDLAGGKGETAPTDTATVMRLKRRLFDRLFGVVAGDEPPDELPERDDEDRDADLGDQLDAAATGRPVAELREERLRGNS